MKTFHLSPQENIRTIALMNNRYLYTIAHLTDSLLFSVFISYHCWFINIPQNKLFIPQITCSNDKMSKIYAMFIVNYVENIKML